MSSVGGFSVLLTVNSYGSPGGEPTLGVESRSMLHRLGLRDIASSQHDLALGKLAVGMNEAEAECVLIPGREHSQGTQHGLGMRGECSIDLRHGGLGLAIASGRVKMGAERRRLTTD